MSCNYVMYVSFTQPRGPPFDETFEEENKTVQEWRSELFPEHFSLACLACVEKVELGLIIWCVMC